MRPGMPGSGLIEPKIPDFWLKIFSNQKRTGNYQVWNVNYWNFYPNYVVFQSKLGTYQTDLNDENSFLLIAENQSTSDIRKFISAQKCWWRILMTKMWVKDLATFVGQNIIFTNNLKKCHQHWVTNMTVALKCLRALSSTIFLSLWSLTKHELWTIDQHPYDLLNNLYFLSGHGLSTGFRSSTSIWSENYF